jgi:hypothetical protein
VQIKSYRLGHISFIFIRVCENTWDQITL